MPIKLHFPFYSVAKCKQTPDDIFIYGDNFDRAGTGGQAKIRFCDNAIGLASKIHPTRAEDAYFTPSHMHDFESEIKRFHSLVTPHLRAGKTVWWPADGVGTGLSEMPTRSPNLYEKLCKYSRGLFKACGDETYISTIICGGRTYTNKDLAWPALDETLGYLAKDAILEVIDGCAKGADTLGGDWASARGLIRKKVKPDWDKYGKRAGFLRNTQMANHLKARRDQAGGQAKVIGLPGGSGTQMMLKISRQNGFDVSTIEDPSYVPPNTSRVKKPPESKDVPQTAMDL